MKTVVIVGAGATLSASLQMKTKETPEPPLDATFFRLAVEQKLTGFASVRRYMFRNHGIRLKQDSSQSMEEVFNYIFSDAHSGNQEDDALEAMWYLIKMYNDSIARTTNTLTGDSSNGVLGLLEKLLDADDNLNLSFVTFNQDLMIEKSLARLNESKENNQVPFSLDKYYGLDFKTFPGTKGFRKEFPVGKKDSIAVIKLHGSLNWEYFVRSENDPKNFLRTPSINDLSCAKAERLLLYATWRPKNRSRDSTLIPVVVPPIYEKSTIYEKLLSPLRKQAENALREAQRLIIFGYSFPDADYMARSLIRRAMHKNKELKDLVVINTDPHICVKAANLCNSDTLFYARSVTSVYF